MSVLTTKNYEKNIADIDSGKPKHRWVHDDGGEGVYLSVEEGEHKGAYDNWSDYWNCVRSANLEKKKK